MGASIQSITNPIRIERKLGGELVIPELAYSVRSPSGRGEKVVYLVRNNSIPDDVAGGDSVWIYHEANVADAQGNVQTSADNHRVALAIDRKVEWRVRISNNPFRSGAGTEITLTPSAKGGNIKTSARIRIYSSIGGLVKDESLTPNTNNGDIVYRWEGRNKDGRYVGTGTYIFRADCELDEGSVKKRHSEQKMIGFVRK
jgi:hypothetical protein